MSPTTAVSNLEQLLDRIDAAAHEAGDRVSLGEILKMIGRRSFGPLLLAAGLITAMPVIGDIPGVPTLMGIFVALIAAQMLVDREHLWLPPWLLKRKLAQDKLRKALSWMRRPARFIDWLLRPRLTALTHETAAYIIAATCLLISATMPAMEVIPFVANLVGIAFTAFGLALITNDGLLSLVAFVCTAATGALIAYVLV